jgi:hypothetical protein
VGVERRPPGRLPGPVVEALADLGSQLGPHGVVLVEHAGQRAPTGPPGQESLLVGAGGASLGGQDVEDVESSDVRLRLGLGSGGGEVTLATGAEARG